MGSKITFAVLLYSCTLIIPNFCQNQGENGNIVRRESFLSDPTTRDKNKNSAYTDAITFVDDTPSQYSQLSTGSASATGDSENSPFDVSLRRGNSRRKSNPVVQGQRDRSTSNSNGGRNHQSGNSQKHEYERPDISSFSNFDTKRRGPSTTNSDASAITFPQDLQPYSSSIYRRRPSYKQNTPPRPRQSPRNDALGSGSSADQTKPLVSTGAVPYSYLTKWIKQYHKQP